MQSQQGILPGEGLAVGIVTEHGTVVVEVGRLRAAGNAGIELPELGRIGGLQAGDAPEAGGEEVVEWRLGGLLADVVRFHIEGPVGGQVSRLGDVANGLEVLRLVEILEGRQDDAVSDAQSQVGQEDEKQTAFRLGTHRRPL